MKRSAVWFSLFALLVGGSSLFGAPRLTSVNPPVAAPGGSIVVAGADLNEVEVLFLTVGATDVQVEITGKTAGEIQAKLPADIAHGVYNWMLQTGGAEPALLVQPLTCEVMSAADAAERLSQLEKEQRDSPVPAPQPPSDAKPPVQ